MTRNRNWLQGGILVALIAGATPAFAARDASQASAQSSAAVSSAVGAVVGGSAEALSAGGELSVVVIERGSEATVLVLKQLGSGVEVSVKLAGQAAGGLSVAVGTTVQVMTEAAGYVLTSAGKAIAFVPNEVGNSLLQHTRLTEATK
ncbi:hypothetical protein [Niveibacterium microcysteis]|uniref:Uncharacterized protein n=1 Tax=Niveibacterium microcysteis TaxID=2811415 RepID=A0ABX7M8C5_9RHOO|nr:hypothetical protein [Niveibacterium microcysteis]QSI76909.1 hypothetical protein JY500_21085 [Niveibacterium microcysteis]